MRRTRKQTRKGGVRPAPLSNNQRIARAKANINARKTAKNSSQFLANFSKRLTSRVNERNKAAKNAINHGAMNNYLKEMYNARNQTPMVSTLRASAPSFVPRS